MSDTVYFKGKLTELKPKEDETVQEMAFNMMSRAEQREVDEQFDGNAIEALQDLYYQEYVLIEGKLYKVETETNQAYTPDIFNASQNEDGTITFELQYYNGGCGFLEAMETAVTRIANKAINADQNDAE
jgi:hypothetical protein